MHNELKSESYLDSGHVETFHQLLYNTGHIIQLINN